MDRAATAVDSDHPGKEASRTTKRGRPQWTSLYNELQLIRFFAPIGHSDAGKFPCILHSLDHL